MRLYISKMIDKERLIGQFITLTKFDCESFSETEIADYLSLELKKLGLVVSEDKVLPGEKCSGNIFAYLPEMYQREQSPSNKPLQNHIFGNCAARYSKYTP